VDRSEAVELIRRAREEWDAEEWLRAADLYERVLAHYPDETPSAVWWYDAALAHKFLRNWAKAYELGREAAARAPRGEGEIDGRFGQACVRLDTGGEREVVWIERLCPTRGRVMNVPGTAGRRFGEIVVHDGEPKGHRVVDGREYPVFDELLLFEASDLPTLTVTVNAAEAADVEALIDVFVARDYGAEPHSSFELLCACCSEGTLERERNTHGGVQRVSLAASEEEARRLLDLWAAQAPSGRAWSDLAPAG
jgi:hypothetical protein